MRYILLVTAIIVMNALMYAGTIKWMALNDLRYHLYAVMLGVIVLMLQFAYIAIAIWINRWAKEMRRRKQIPDT